MSNQNEIIDSQYDQPLREFYKLCVGDASADDLVKALADCLDTQVLLRLARPEGQALKAPDLFEYQHKVKLEWRGEKLGTLYSGAPVPVEMLRAISLRLYRLQRTNIRIADKLCEEVARGSGDIPVTGVSPLVVGDMYLLIYADTSKLDAKSRQEFCDALLKLPLSTAAAHDENRACAICAISGALDEELMKLLNSYDTRAAISAPFDCGRIGRQVELMRLCLYAGMKISPKERLYHFDEYASSVFMLMASRHADLSLYQCEIVTGLSRLDKMRGTNLSDCLYEYLMCFAESKKAVSNLGIKRADFDNNMRKISMIMGGPLSNEKRFDMLNTYNLLALSCADFNVARFSCIQPL